MEPNLKLAIEEQSRILRDISDHLSAQDSRWAALESVVARQTSSIQQLETAALQVAATSERLDAVESATAAFETWRPSVEAAVDDVKYSVDRLCDDFAKFSASALRSAPPGFRSEMGVLGPRPPTT
jgi:sulfite reductase alpha subunit-like flavoprotein